MIDHPKPGTISVKTSAATALLFFSAQAAWADCAELKKQYDANMAALTEAGDRYRPIAAEHLADRLLIKDLQPSVKAVSDAIPETERMIAAMDKYFEYMNSMKDGGCYGPAETAVIAMFKSQRDQLLVDQKRLAEFVKRHQ
jgi:hypothetical protein